MKQNLFSRFHLSCNSSRKPIIPTQFLVKPRKANTSGITHYSQANIIFSFENYYLPYSGRSTRKPLHANKFTIMGFHQTQIGTTAPAAHERLPRFFLSVTLNYFTIHR